MSETLKVIDTDRFSASLRQRGIDLTQRSIRLTRFSGSLQERDLTLKPNCGGYGRVHHFRRRQIDGWLPNPLPIDPAYNALGLASEDTVQVQVFQNAICSWRCWYCYVDFDLLTGDPARSGMLTAAELMDLYLQEPSRSPIIDLSGGQPDLVPEWGAWLLQEVRARGLEREVYVWSDDNLSNDYLWRYLCADDIATLANSRNYGRVGCFKGFDPHSFSFNTRASPTLFDRQFELMKRLIDAGFDVYAYVTLTSDQGTVLAEKMSRFIDRLQAVHPLLPLRTIPLEIVEFTPTARRMQDSGERAMRIQHHALECWQEGIERRFSSEMRERRIHEQSLS